MTTQPRKILVIEDERDLSLRHKGFDSVFSFVGQDIPNRPDDYLTYVEKVQIQNDLFDAFMDYLESARGRHFLVYQGIDLLWCFKKILYEFSLHVVLRLRVLERLLEKNPGTELALVRRSQEKLGLYPYLCNCLSDTAFGTAARVHYVDPSSERRRRSVQSGLALNPRRLWPFVISTSLKKKAEVLIFADPVKASAVVKKIGASRCVWYSDLKAPRHFFGSLRSTAGFFQSEYPPGNRRQYEKLSSEFAQRVRQDGLIERGFFGFYPGLLDRMIVELCGTILPKLLFDIDQIRLLLNQVPGVRSLLLDEDIAPTKCACAQIARMRGVSSFVECHGALGHSMGVLPLTADRIFSWGRAQKEKLMKWGCPAERIEVSGTARYEYHQQLDCEEVREKIAAKYRLNPREGIVLVGFMPVINRRNLFEGQRKDVIFGALEVLRRLPHLQFIIKAHPGDDMVGEIRARTAKEEKKGRIRIIEKEDPLLLARAADLLVVYRSTYAVDGFALGKQVILLFDHRHQMLDEYRPYKVFHYAESHEKLEALLNDYPLGAYPADARVREVREDCLNATGESASSFIARRLLEGVTEAKPRQAQSEVPA